MAYMTWDEVMANPKYQALPDPKKEEARNQYFRDVVAPQIPEEHREPAYKKFLADTRGMEIDAEIKDLEAKVVPEPSTLDNIKRNLTLGLGESNEEEAKRVQNYYNVKRLEALKSLKELNHPENVLEEYKSAVVKGAKESTMGNLVKDYVIGGDSKYDITYEPDTTGQKIVSGVAKIGMDLPLYATGGAITTGGKIAKAAGSFALPASLDAMLEYKKQHGGTIDLEHTPDAAWEVAKAGAEAGLTGAAVGTVGQLGKLAGGVAKSPGKQFLIEKGVNIPAVGGTLLGIEAAKGNPITAGTVGETIGTIAVMELLGGNPFAKARAEARAKELGIPVEKVAENIDPEMLKRVKSVEELEMAIDQGAVKSEAKLRQEKTEAIQNQIIEQQIKANYKEGKSPEEIIQLTQIKREYLPLIADEVDGVYKVKPEIYERMKAHQEAISPKNNPFGDADLPFETIDPVQRLKALRDEHIAATEAYETHKANEPEIRKGHIDEWMSDMGKKRYENLPEVRGKMDHTIEYTLNHLTPKQMIDMIEHPELIKSYLPAEANYDALSPKYQKSLNTELQHAMIQYTGHLPATISGKAGKYAELQYKKKEAQLLKTLDAITTEGKAIRNEPAYKDAIEADKIASYNDTQKNAYFGKQLDSIDKDYEAEIAKSNEYLQPQLQKALGTSLDYGDRALDAKEVYGSHYNNLVEWFKTPTEKLTETFERMGFLNMKVNEKAGLENKSRIIQGKLGEKAFRAFTDPIREVTYTFTKELSIYKDKLKALKEGMSAKDRQDIGAYMLGKQTDALPTLQKMKIIPPKWENLTPKQQAAINEFNQIYGLVFDRVNASREAAGLEPFLKVNNYFTFIRKFSMLEELGFDPLRVKTSVFDNVQIEDVKTRSLSFAFGKQRQDSLRNLELDAFAVMDKYLYAALKTTHFTPVIGKLRKALDSEKLMLSNPNGWEYLHMTLDVVSGKKISEAKEITNYLANVVHRNLTTATLSGNLHTVVIQPSSALIAGNEIGAKYLALGLKDFSNENMRKFAMREAKVLLTRTYDATFDEIKKGVTGKISAVQTKAAEIGNLPTKYTDLFAAEVTWLGSYRYATEQLKLNHKGCVTYADDLVIRTQGSADRLDLAPIQHTPLGKLATTFQTFAINQFGYLKDEILGLGKVHKLVGEGVSKKEVNERYNSAGFIKKPVGDGKYNVYETRRVKETSETLKSAAKFGIILGVMNTIYELMGVNPPNPAPVSAFYEGLNGQGWVDALYGNNPTKKEAALIDGFLASLRESGMIVPIVGGAAKYGGGNVGGAMGGLLTETFDALAGRPAAKPWEYILSRWAGVPGATQTYKTLKALKKERTEEHKQDAFNSNPIEYMKRQAGRDNPVNKARRELFGNPRYKDPGLLQGAIDQLSE